MPSALPIAVGELRAVVVVVVGCARSRKQCCLCRGRLLQCRGRGARRAGRGKGWQGEGLGNGVGVLERSQLLDAVWGLKVVGLGVHLMGRKGRHGVRGPGGVGLPPLPPPVGWR